MLAALPALALCPAPAVAAVSLAACIAGPWRSARNVARDRYRHPAAVLGFFGVTARRRVLEIEPGGGYWTEILAPYLKRQGRYIAALPSAGAEARAADQRFLAKLAANPGLYGEVEVTGLDVPPLRAAGSVDMVLSFRNLHDWMADGTAAAKLAAVHAVLRPGGVFGIEDHRAAATAPQDPRATSGYVREDYAAGLIERAGFRLTGRSEVGANPRDTKDYPKGVWTLPPSLAAGAADRARYLAIGESDRWTMRFVKRG